MKREFKIAALAAAVALSGCASDSASTSSLPLETNQAQEQVSVQINKVKQSIDSAEKKLQEAKENKLDWFATLQVRDAQNALAEAKEYYAEYELDPSEANSSSGFFSSTTNIQATEESLAKFNAHLTKAEAIRVSVQTVLEEALSYRDQLNKINAVKYYPTSAKQLERKIKTLVDYVADEKAERAISAQPELVRKQRALEVRTVTRIYLYDAQTELKRLKQARISMHAPETLAQGAAAVKAAEAFIAAEPRATAQIIDKADEAMFSLKHAQQIANVVKKLKAMPEKDYERHVLSFEKILLNVSLALGSEDVRDQPISKQGKHLVDFIKANQQGEQESAIAQQKLRSELGDEKARAAILEKKVAELSAQLLAAQQAPVLPLTAPVQAVPVAPIKTATVAPAPTSAPAATPAEAAEIQTPTPAKPEQPVQVPSEEAATANQG